MKKCICDKVAMNDVEYQEHGTYGLPFCKKCGGALFNFDNRVKIKLSDNPNILFD